MVHKSLSHGTEDASDIDKVLSINYQVNAHHTNRFAHKQSCLPLHQLVDKEANGGLAASDMRILQKTGRQLNVVGIGNHELTGFVVVAAACPFQLSSGKPNDASKCMLSEVDWGVHETHTSGCMLSEVDWGAHDSIFSLTWSPLTMMESQGLLHPRTFHKENL